MVGKKEKYLVAAQKFTERGQLDKALVEFNKVVLEDPKDTRTWLKMAELHAKRGANAEATEIYLRTGDLYTEQGFAQKAVAVYKNVLKLSPGTVAAHLKLGTLFNQLGLVSDAVQQFELAAASLQRSNKSPEGVAALRQAIEIQPDNVVLRVKLAESASQAGLTDEAVREFGKAADQLKAQGRADESLRVVERLLFHQPENFAKARELAEAYIAKGSPRLALPKLQACLNGDPRDPLTLSLLAKALEQLGQVPKAISVLKELVRLCDDLGRSNERDAAVLRGLTLDPTDRDLRAIAVRHHLRGTADAGGDATPPPVGLHDATAGGGSFDLSGVVRIPAGGASGRVLAPVGVGEDKGLGTLSGVSSGADPDVNRILAEADVFVKYGLLERAADHLARVFEFDPGQRDAREKLITVLQLLGRKDEASHHGELLARQGPRPSPGAAAPLAANALGVDLHSGQARGRLGTPSKIGSGITLGIASDDDDDPAVDMLTPPPARLPTGPASVATPAVGSSDFDDEVHTGDVLFNISGDAELAFTGAPNRADAEDEEQETPPPRALPRVLDIVDLSSVDVDDGDAFGGDAATIAGGLDIVDLSSVDVDEGGAFGSDAATIAGSLDIVDPAVADVDEGELSAELEQVSFFVDQAMSEEAHSLLQDLEARFPRNPRVAAMMKEIQAEDARRNALILAAAGASAFADRPRVGSTIIERPTRRGETAGPRAVMAGGESSDASTHADLAIAYKGMGLFDAAIGELRLLAEDPEREVFALTAMGECFEAKGTFTEAVLRYKRALNCEQVTREETLALYFLLGGAFERLGDVSEALYFFEKVAKREPTFPEVQQRVADLKPRLVKRAR